MRRVRNSLEIETKAFVSQTRQGWPWWNGWISPRSTSAEHSALTIPVCGSTSFLSRITSMPQVAGAFRTLRSRKFAVIGLPPIFIGLLGYMIWPRPDSARLLQLAWMECEAARFDRAQSLLDRRAKLSSATALDWLLRSRIAKGRGKVEQALEALRQVSDDDPLAGEVNLQIGRIELDRDRARVAEDAMLHALSLDPARTMAHRELAYVYAIQHRRTDCSAQFRALNMRLPVDAKLAFVWTQNDCSLWDPKETRDRLERFVEADPNDRRSRLALAESLLALHLPDEAEDVLSPLSTADPETVALRSRSALDRNDFDSATTLAERASLGHPALSTIRGRLAMSRQDFGEAARLFREAIRADPDDRHAIQGLSRALQAMGDAAGAAPLLETVRKRDRLRSLVIDSKTNLGKDPKVFLKLARATEDTGALIQAIAWYRLAITLDPLDSEAQRGLSRVSLIADDE